MDCRTKIFGSKNALDLAISLCGKFVSTKAFKPFRNKKKICFLLAPGRTGNKKLSFNVPGSSPLAQAHFTLGKNRRRQVICSCSPITAQQDIRAFHCWKRGI